MPTTLTACAALLTSAGIRHHLDAEDAAIRVVFVTRRYTNPRGERLAIVRIETPDGGRRLRAAIARAFAVPDDPATGCLTLCRLAADTPLVGIEYEPACAGLHLVVEIPVEEGHVTKLQICAALDGLVEAAEHGHAALEQDRRSRQAA